MAAKSSSFQMWLTLGFVIGIGFGWLVFHRSDAHDVPTARKAGATSELPFIPDAPQDTATLGQVEELFQTWGGYCVWENNISQFAISSSKRVRHPDYYEVRRSGTHFYFRILPRPDWPFIDHGELARCPIHFAETRAMHEKYYRDHPDAIAGDVKWVDKQKLPPILPPRAPEAERPDFGSRSTSWSTDSIGGLSGTTGSRGNLSPSTGL